MSNKVDYSGLSQIDASLKRYFSSYMAPSIVNAKKSVNAEIADERKKYIDEFNTHTLAMTMPKTFRSLGPIAYHNEKGKTTQDPAGGVIRKVRDAWSKNKKIQEDIETFKVHFFQELLKRYPQKDINQLAAFADDYVNSRIDQLVIEQMARSGVPKGTIEYCINNGFADSLAGVIFRSFTFKSAESNERVREKSNAMYNPSWKERVGANAIAMGVDAAMTGGYASGNSLLVKGATKAGIKVAPKIASFMNSAWSGATFDGSLRAGLELYNIKNWNDEEYKRDVSKKVLGDKDGIKKIQEGAEKYKRTATEKTFQLNHDLKNKVKTPNMSFGEKTSTDMNRYYHANKGNSDKIYNDIKAKFKKQALSFNANSMPPQWMISLGRKRCEQCAAGFSSIAMEMSRTGKDKANVLGKRMTIKEVSQRAIDYAKAAVILHEEEKEKVRQRSAARSSETRHQEQKEDVPTREQNQQQAAKPQQSVPKEEGWKEAIDELGGGEFGEMTKNLGYIMAMLPDMIIGMFTGKNPDMKLEDNLIPMASIAAGLLVTKNPLLKMALLGYGGLNIFNSAGKAALKQSREGNQARTYRTYADEPLSSRISNPVIKGRSMVADIDGIPTVITINNEVIEAYEEGHIPLNTLANAALAKYDANRTAASQHYEHGINEQQEKQQNIHIR